MAVSNRNYSNVSFVTTVSTINATWRITTLTCTLGQKPSNAKNVPRRLNLQELFTVTARLICHLNSNVIPVQKCLLENRTEIFTWTFIPEPSPSSVTYAIKSLASQLLFVTIDKVIQLLNMNANFATRCSLYRITVNYIGTEIKTVISLSRCVVNKSPMNLTRVIPHSFINWFWFLF